MRKYFKLSDRAVGHDIDDKGNGIDLDHGCFVFSKTGWHAYPCYEEGVVYDEAGKDEK